MNNRTGTDYSSYDLLNIDLYCVIVDVSREWLSIILLSVASVLLANVILTNFRAPNYATSATMVIRNDDESETANNTSGSEIYENLSYGADSASRLKNILESKELKMTVARDLGLSHFEGKISANTLGDSNLLKITVQAKSPLLSYRETESVLRNYEDFSRDLIGGTELTILEKPKVPERAINRRQNLRYSFYFGMIVFLTVCAVLALLSMLRDTVHNSTEVETKLDTRLLATIQHEANHRRGKKRIRGEKTSILITDPIISFQYTEDMRKLAARILNEMSEKNQKVLLVSSAAENEGKSTISVNIALAMTQINKRVVLVDLDLRKSSLHKILNMQEIEFNELSTAIAEKAKEEHVDSSAIVKSLLCKVPGTDLSVILNRKSMSQAVEKYPEFIEIIIEELKNHADYILLDTPPMSLVSDAEELASMADTSVIVVRQHWIEARAINDTIDALGGKDRMLGCVFNNVHKSRMSGAASGYGYGYGYGYGGHHAK